MMAKDLPEMKVVMFEVSLRDWFAGQAMIGILQGGIRFIDKPDDASFEELQEKSFAVNRETTAIQAYRQADAMIAARSKP